MDNLIKVIESLAKKYADNLKQKIANRVIEMQNDDNSHYLIYQVLGISKEEGEKIDLYQNKGRFLYKYAGSFLEEATILCLKHKYPKGIKTRVKNTLGQKPQTFEIDFLNEMDAFEIKWKDATTDGDHITKEHTRLKVIQSYQYKPIRLMFYEPNRDQAIKIQQTLATLYKGVNGDYYAGESAWQFLNDYTGINLKMILENIAHNMNNL